MRSDAPTDSCTLVKPLVQLFMLLASRATITNQVAMSPPESKGR
jgi:hypothetical protein